MTVKQDRLREQKKIADELSELLGELNDDTGKSLSTMHAAVALSQRPGKLNYYQSPQNISNYTKNDEVKRLVQKIKEIEHDIRKTEDSFHQAESSRVNIAKSREDITGVDSFEQWHSRHNSWRDNSAICGRSTKTKMKEAGPGEGYFTTFKQKPRHFGGTGVHQGFDSQALTMKRGRITR